MKLTGNNLLAMAVFTLANQLAFAENITSPEITAFTAGTPAKASEVNNNFEALKAYGDTLKNVITAQAALIESLETKVATLESSSSGAPDEFTIAVSGDGELIGYTNRVLHNTDKPFIQVKTSLGMAAIQGVYEGTGYFLDGYDELSEHAGRNGSVMYSNDTCTLNPSRVINANEIPQLVFTKVANTIDNSDFIYNGKATYFIEAGTVFTKTTSESTKYSYNSWDDSCTESAIPVDSLITPVVEVSFETHGLKSTYSTITIDGYASPL